MSSERPVRATWRPPHIEAGFDPPTAAVERGEDGSQHIVVHIAGTTITGPNAYTLKALLVAADAAVHDAVLEHRRRR